MIRSPLTCPRCVTTYTMRGMADHCYTCGMDIVNPLENVAVAMMKAFRMRREAAERERGWVEGHTKGWHEGVGDGSRIAFGHVLSFLRGGAWSLPDHVVDELRARTRMEGEP